MKSKSLKELVTDAINALRECAIIHTKMVTWDSFSTDGWAGYINTSTIGVSDPTKYYWFIGRQPVWTQHNQIQDVSANGFTMRCWYMASPSDGKVILLRNTKPTAFRIIGIRKVGGVLRKLYLSTTSLWKGGGVDEGQEPKRTADGYIRMACSKEKSNCKSYRLSACKCERDDVSGRFSCRMAPLWRHVHRGIHSWSEDHPEQNGYGCNPHRYGRESRTTIQSVFLSLLRQRSRKYELHEQQQLLVPSTRKLGGKHGLSSKWNGAYGKDNDIHITTPVKGVAA